MANYRYLGYGITDENGIAKLDHDANGDPITHSYTGTGAGKVDIVASLDDQSHISDSSIQSETYEVLDAKIFETFDNNTKQSTWATMRCVSTTTYTIEDNSLKTTAFPQWAWIDYYIMPNSSHSLEELNSITNIRCDVSIEYPLRLIALWRKSDQTEIQTSYIDIDTSGTYDIPVNNSETMIWLGLRATNKNSNENLISIDNIVFY